MGNCERQKLYIRPVGIPQAYLYLSWNLFKVFMVFFGIVSNKSFEEIFSLFLQNSFNRTIKPLSPLNVKHRLVSHCNYSHSVSNRKANNSCFEFSILTQDRFETLSNHASDSIGGMPSMEHRDHKSNQHT